MAFAAAACAGLAVEFGYLKPKRTKAEISDVLNTIKRTRINTRKMYTGGTGIVIGTNSIDTNLFIVLSGVRYTGCSLPITVFTTEMPTDIQIKQIGQLGNIDVVYRKAEPIKLIAVLESSYAEVILLNPDFFVLQDLSLFLSDPEYRSTGLLMWNATPTDRSTIFSGGGAAAKWIRGLIPYTVRGNVILNDKGTAQASGMITIIDKGKHLKGMSALYAFTKMWNDTTLGSKLGTDDELFWLAAEIVGEPYSFIGNVPGKIGSKFGNKVRGLPVYFDDKWQMLGIYDEHGKLFEEYRTTDFELWTDGYTVDPESVPLNVREIINWYFWQYSKR